MLFPQNWRTSMQDVSAAIDDTMGELVTVTPFNVTQVNFPAVRDQSLQAATVTAVFTRKSDLLPMGKTHSAGGWDIQPLVSTSKPIFSFGYGVLPFPIRQHYRITRLCSGETFEVTDIKPDGVSRIEVRVVQLGRQKEDQ